MSLGRWLPTVLWILALVFTGSGGGPLEVDGGPIEDAPVPGHPTIVA